MVRRAKILPILPFYGEQELQIALSVVLPPMVYSLPLLTHDFMEQLMNTEISRAKATAKTADDLIILVDVSNTDDYMGTQKKEHIILDALKFRLKGTAGSAGNAQLKVGVILENDGTNGTLGIIAESDLVGYNEEYESSWMLFPRGFSLRVDSDDLVDGEVPQLEDNIFQNDQGDLTDTAGNSSLSTGAGDLVVFLDEGTNGGTYEYEAVALWHLP